MGQVLDFMFKLDVAMSGKFDQPMRAFNSQMDKITGTIKKLQEESGRADSFQKLSAQAEATSSRLKYLRSSYASNNAGLQQSRQQTQSLSEQYEAAKKRVADWSRVMPKNSSMLMLARKRAAELKQEYSQSARSTQQLELQQQKLYKAIGLAEEKLSGETSQLEALRKSLHEAGVNTQNLSGYHEKLAQTAQRYESARSKFSSLREQLTWGNIKADLMKAAGFIKTFQKPIVIDMEFEQAMANVNAVMNPLKKDFEALRDQALQLGSTTQFTATQAANAQEVLARAGLSVNEVIDAMPALLSMSAAEGLEIAQAADIIVNSLQGLRLSTGYADILTDLYAYTSAHSNTNIAELGEAMKAAAPVAATINLPAESLLALLGSMTSAARGGEAGTALASSLPRMYAPTKKARNAYAEIGVAYKTRSGGVVRPEILLENIAKKTKGLGTADQLRIYEAIFGKNHLSAMSALMQNIAGGTYTELHGGLVSKRDGSSSKMVSLRNNTLKGDITSLGSAWEGLMIRIGNALDPINRFFTQSITAGIQYINELIDRMGPFADVLARGAYVLGGYMIVAKVYKYASLAVKTFGAFLELKAASKGLESLGAINTGLQTATQSATIFGVSLGKALGIIGAIAFATYEIVTHWKEITEWASKAGEAISSIPTTGHDVAIPRGNINYGVSVMDSTFQPPEIKAHAMGGILTRPHLGLVAEAGPEAVIPLRDKTRGVSVLSQAANLLGVETRPQIFMTRSDSHDRRFDSNNSISVNHFGGNREFFTPVINLTVNTSNNDTSITERIKSAVTEALEEIYSRQERLSYAV